MYVTWHLIGWNSNVTLLCRVCRFKTTHDCYHVTSSNFKVQVQSSNAQYHRLMLIHLICEKIILIKITMDTLIGIVYVPINGTETQLPDRFR